jgi:UDP-N-acetylmuramoyl-L-alanyl-D-glutamate--2,6-diaminopimelate ligase
MEENFIKKDKPSSTADTDKIYFIEENRSIAIKEGISIAKPGDVVLIAGKGHETYQISGNNKYHFDDREEAMRALKLCA